AGEEPRLIRERVVQKRKVTEGRHRLEQVKTNHRPPHRRLLIDIFFNNEGLDSECSIGAKTRRGIADRLSRGPALFQPEDCASVIEVVIRRGETGHMRAQKVVLRRRTECDWYTSRLMSPGSWRPVREQRAVRAEAGRVVITHEVTPG